jgi:hypothetical protein
LPLFKPKHFVGAGVHPGLEAEVQPINPFAFSSGILGVKYGLIDEDTDDRDAANNKQCFY